MAAFHSQVMQSTSYFHYRIRKAILSVTENIFHNATTFDTCNRIFNTDPGSGNDAVQTTICLAQHLAFRFFLAET